MECICCRTGVTLVRDIVPPASSQYLLLAAKLMDTVQNCSISTNYAEFSYITCKQTVATRINQSRRMPASGSPRPIPASGRVVPQSQRLFICRAMPQRISPQAGRRTVRLSLPCERAGTAPRGPQGRSPPEYARRASCRSHSGRWRSASALRPSTISRNRRTSNARRSATSQVPRMSSVGFQFAPPCGRNAPLLPQSPFN